MTNWSQNMGRTLRTGTASIFAALVLLASAIPQVHASLIGDTVDLSWHEPTPTTLLEDDGLQVADRVSNIPRPYLVCSPPTLAHRRLLLATLATSQRYLFRPSPITISG